MSSDISGWIAGGAAVVSGIVATFQWRLASRVARLERSPVFEVVAEIDVDAPDDLYVLFKNNGPADYTDVIVELQRGSVGWMPIDSLKFASGWALSGSLGPMKVGEQRPVLVRRVLEAALPATARFRLTCTTPKGDWVTSAECRIPSPPRFN